MRSHIVVFGYIRPFKPSLRICEFETYKAFYCGLCKQIGSAYGPFARLTLSYDFTFMSMLLSGLSEERDVFKKKRCLLNPIKKKGCAEVCENLLFSADTAIIMIYYKIKDNIEDGKFFDKLKYRAVIPFFNMARKKAALRQGNIDDILNEVVLNQFALEKEIIPGIDRAAHPFANGLELIFETFSENVRQKRVLKRLGYLLGRYIYLIDALDDFKKDLKNRNYNPFLIKFLGVDFMTEKIKTKLTDGQAEEIREYAGEVILQTVSELQTAFELLEIKKYKPILDNIIHQGLAHSLAYVSGKIDK